MSQLQKLRAKQNKVKVVFSFEKTFEGVEITVKSPKLGGLIRHFIDNYENYNDVWALTILRSLQYSDHFYSNKIISGQYINLGFLNRLNERKTSVKAVFNNVFTNNEIKQYIENFETYLMKIKQLYNNEKIPLIEVRSR